MFERLQFLALAAAAMGAGTCVVIQQVLNASLRGEVGSAFWAALISYLGGTLTLLLILLLFREPWIAPVTGSNTSLLSWTGGIFGTVYIVASILLLPRLGAMNLVALLIAGQMLTSVVFDHYGLFGLAQRPIDMSRMIGAALLMTGVVLVRS